MGLVLKGGCWQLRFSSFFQLLIVFHLQQSEASLFQLHRCLLFNGGRTAKILLKPWQIPLDWRWTNSFLNSAYCTSRWVQKQENYFLSKTGLASTPTLWFRATVASCSWWFSSYLCLTGDKPFSWDCINCAFKCHKAKKLRNIIQRQSRWSICVHSVAVCFRMEQMTWRSTDGSRPSTGMRFLWGSSR